VRFDDITTLSKEMGASTDNSWDFFSEFSNNTKLSNDGDFFSQYSNNLTDNTAINSPIVTPVGVLPQAEAEAEIQLNTEDTT